jgi:gamma-glutamyltranspeptidase / glutathione hydrolase
MATVTASPSATAQDARPVAGASPFNASRRGDRYSGPPFASRSAVIARHGMACTSHPLATQIALDMLKAGGTAVDAAIAANAALGVMEPTGNGIGGDLFAMVWDGKKGRLHGLNGSGRAPLGQSLRELTTRVEKMAARRTDAGKADDKGVPDWGSLSITVPGAVDAWFELQERFGKLKMAQVLAPAIDAARNGFPVTELIAHYLQRNMATFEKLHKAGVVEEFDNARRVHLRAGKTAAEGEIFTNPDLARALELIAQGGRDVFYKGVLADSMDSYFRRIGAPLRKKDFAAHASDWVEPVSANYRGIDMFELPPNGQGTSALLMLNILENFDLKSMGFGSADHLHVMVEAKKLAFEDRARFYADPDFYTKPVLKKLLAKDYAQARAKLIDMQKAATRVDHGDAKLVEGDTIYLTVADKDGMMVSLIQSNYRGLGSGLVPDGPDGRTLGFMFQDRGAQFALDPRHPNAYAPGKRPFHTIIPAFAMKDGKPFLSFGLMGGDMQPQGHAQIIVNMVDFGMGVQQAGDAARFYHTGSTDATWDGRMADGGTLELESGFAADVVADLVARGHTAGHAIGNYGGYQAIGWDDANKVYRGASEFRKDGQAAGY